ncbi:MAG TPA: PLP-dependent aminotransferase family protein, partial [Ktedonobacterales bacterium]|nr:PLP-dependent aminotransferase family protein [Ktedonobacterales bacterium]
LPPGDRLPTVRQLAADLGLTRLTVHSAYAELQAQGLIESVVGRGTFVATHSFIIPPSHTRTVPQPPAPWHMQGLLAEIVGMTGAHLLTFAQAHPAPETFPTRELGKALRAALDDPAALSYGVIQGERALREQISRLLLDRGITTSPDHVLVTAGAQQALRLALEAFTTPEDVVLVEEPTYPGALELAALRGQRVVSIPIDSEGISLPALDAACLAYRPRLLYLVPTYHNPTGNVLSPERHTALLRIARAHHMLIVEDDVYGFLSLDGPPPLPLKATDNDGMVIYSTSFSKIFIPGLRLGAIVAAPAYLPKLAACKQSTDLTCSPLLQQALADYLRHGYLATHLHHVRSLYRERRDMMLAALERFLPTCAWTHPTGGLNIWVTLPEQISEYDFVHAARERGIGVAPGRLFFPQPRRDAFMRLSFGAQPPERIEEGIARLGQVLQEHLRQHHETLVRAGREAGPLV